MIKRLLVTGAAAEALTERGLVNARLAPPGGLALAGERTETKRLGGPAAPPRPDGASGGGTMEVSQVEGRVQAQSIRRLVDLVEQYPDESLSIVRGWLSEGEKE